MAKTAKHSDRIPTHQEIAELARQIYEQSGRIPGRDLENWLAAESQLIEKRTPAARAQRTQTKPASAATIHR